MSLFSNSVRLGASGKKDPHEIDRSLRFNRSDNAQLTRTLSASNRTTWTWSGWIKLTGNTSENFLFGVATASSSGDSSYTVINFNQNDLKVSMWTAHLRQTNAKFRDTNGWYHIVVTFDSNNGTVDDRCRIYSNGTRITSFSTNATISSGFEPAINTNDVHTIGGSNDSNQAYDGYMAEVHFVDGQALDASSFGETNTTTGQWVAKKYGGSYGTNGFYLTFSDNSNTTAATLGKDSSGNGNNWTPNNFSVAAGAGNDSLVDNPTNNFSTLNPLLTDTRSDTSFSNGNLTATTGSGAAPVGSSFAVNSGKWYAEYVCTAKTSVNMMVGVNTVMGYDGERQNNESQNGGLGYGYINNGNKSLPDGSNPSYGASWSENDVIGIALDMDSNEVTFYKNNSSQGAISITGGYFYCMTFGGGQSSSTQTFDVNYGQRALAYTPPTNFKTLCVENIPEPTIADGSSDFNTVLYTGNATSRSIASGFATGFVWIKRRSGTEGYVLANRLVGADSFQSSDSDAAQNTASNCVTAFNSDGVTVGTQGIVNDNTETFVSWHWKAGGSGVSNGDGTINSSVIANASAGFSIATYTGDNAGGNSTVGHGLGVAPEFVLIKRSASAGDWIVGHDGLATNAFTNTKFLKLNTNASVFTNALVWGAQPTSTVVQITTGAGAANLNASGGTYIMYSFVSVAGYSKVGKYTGNALVDGTFVYTGFKPAVLLVKCINSTEDWQIWDNKRDTTNLMFHRLFPSNTDGGSTSIDVNTSQLDFLSNGFKWRGKSDDTNGSGDTYVYLAMAERSFKYANAR